MTASLAWLFPAEKWVEVARNFREEQKHDERAVLMVFYWTQL
jgi:hypothetical protein